MSEDDKTYSQEIQDRIRELAHSMWEWAGRQQNAALEYWLAAEKEVLASLHAAAEKLTSGEKPEQATEPETAAAAAPAPAPAAPAPATTPETVETGAKPAGEAEAVEHPQPKAAKPKVAKPKKK